MATTRTSRSSPLCCPTRWSASSSATCQSACSSRLVSTQVWSARTPARHGGALHSFTLGFEGSGADERAGARRLAGVIGTKHAEDVVGPGEALDALPGLLAAHGEPSQSLLQSHFVAAFARQDVKVALAGVGGDELFGSYPSHVIVNALARFDALPAPLRRAAVSLSRAAPDERVRRLAALAGAAPRRSRCRPAAPPGRPGRAGRRADRRDGGGRRPRRGRRGRSPSTGTGQRPSIRSTACCTCT